MQSENRFFDDLAKVANGALGSIAGFGSELEARLRDQAEKVLARMDVVRREEFDAVKAMAQKARETQEALEMRVAALEAELASLRIFSPEKANPIRFNACAESRNPAGYP